MENVQNAPEIPLEGAVAAPNSDAPAVPMEDAKTPASKSTADASKPMAAMITTEGKNKRPSETELPELSKEIAMQRFQQPCPKPPKTKTDYIRFKALLLKKAKDEGKTVPTAKEAQAAWKAVKDAWALNADIDEIHFSLKVAAQKEAKEEKAAHDGAVAEWAKSFSNAAKSYLQYVTMEATMQDFSALEAALATIRENTKEWPKTVKQEWNLKLASQELARLRLDRRVRDLAASLRNADEEALMKHCRMHIVAMNQATKLRAQEKKAAAELAAKRPSPAFLKDAMLKSLKSQMIYKKHLGIFFGEPISCECDYVTPAIFAEAFDVPVGTRVAELSGDLIPPKSLKYGGSLQLRGNIRIELQGETAIAKASYNCYRAGM